MKELLDKLVELLRTESAEPLASTPVEKYWRSEPPTEATVYVFPVAWPEQIQGIGAQTASPCRIGIVVEVPWADTQATTCGDALCDLVDQIRGIIRDNRQVTTAGGQVWQRGRLVECDINYVLRAENAVAYTASMAVEYTRVGE